MKRALAIVALLALTVLVLAGSRTVAPAPAQDEPRFAAYDVCIDSGSAPLAAWQVEIVASSGRAKLVGVEGGDAGAFAAPPYYDPKALMSERIVLAAFDTGSALPSGRTRVARLHVEVQGAAEPRFEARVVAAASRDGRTIDVSVEVRP
ncbi:MAG: hypothetical protein HZA53_17605 [Planctomycetes bacterium]|nr:hypothetical protein [Planctomycetota bacterium]